MVTVSITAKAFAAIEATLPEGSEAEARRTVRASISLRCRRTFSTNLTTYAARARAAATSSCGWRRATRYGDPQAASVFVRIVTTSRRLQRWWSWRAG
jgi:hypothetical protein